MLYFYGELNLSILKNCKTFQNAHIRGSRYIDEVPNDNMTIFKAHNSDIMVLQRKDIDKHIFLWAIISAIISNNTNTQKFILK